MRYFVIAVGGSNLPLPIIDEDDNIYMFDSYEDAEKMAEHQIICSARGYEIIEWDYDELDYDE